MTFDLGPCALENIKHTGEGVTFSKVEGRQSAILKNNNSCSSLFMF